MDDTHTPADPVEDRLRHALTAGIAQVEAEAGPPVADPVDLSRRRVLRHRRRQAGAAAAAAIVLVGAAAGGWAIGRQADDPDTVEQMAGSTTTPTTATASDDGGAPTPGIEVTEGELPLVRPEGGGAPAPPMTFDEGDQGVRLMTPYGPYSSGPGQPSAPLFHRTLDDGTELDVRGNRYDEAMFDLPPFWDPPAWCFPAGDVYVGARLPEAVGQMTGVRYAGTEPEAVMVSTTVIGTAEGHPQWLVVAQAPDGAAEVRATFAGGGEDAMAPVAGLAVLTAPIADGVEPVDPWAADQSTVPSITVVATDAQGTEVGRYEGPWAGGGPRTPEPREGCARPDALPAPGAEQPADPAGAEAAVRTVWETAFGNPGSLPVEEQMTYLDDPRGVAAAQAAVADRYPPDTLAEIAIPVDGVVFADPERAFIEYTVDADGAGLGTFPDRFAELVLIDGSWKITRASACSLALLGGGTCELPSDG